jgi:hypothetical protein
MQAGIKTGKEKTMKHYSRKMAPDVMTKNEFDYAYDLASVRGFHPETVTCHFYYNTEMTGDYEEVPGIVCFINGERREIITYAEFRNFIREYDDMIRK